MKTLFKIIAKWQQFLNKLDTYMQRRAYMYAITNKTVQYK